MSDSRKIKIVLILAITVLVVIFGVVVFIILSNLPILVDVESDPNINVFKLPPLLQDENPAPGVALFTLSAQSGVTNFFADRNTQTMGYNGSYLGPILRMTQGDQVSIRVNNNLDEPTTIHWHGLVVPGDQDGGPHQVIAPGDSWTPSFTVVQPAATLWFHPHAMRTTATQVYSGLAGLIYIDDPISARLDLPKDYGINDFPLIIQDRNFDQDGRFNYQANMMGLTPGETILVNGTISPILEVPHGKVRFRILNASNSEDYRFSLSDGIDFIQIASDGGFLAEPLSRQTIDLSPGERAEVVIDFARISGKSVQLNLGNLPILDLHITGVQLNQPDLPAKLADIVPFPASDNQKIRIFELQSMGISGTINGKSFDMDRIDEVVLLNETEVWVIRNRGGMMMQSGGHPFHVHGTQFQVISRNGQTPPPEEAGFKDTVFVGVGEEVQLRIRFSQPGVYMYHCHILEHEENGMMGQIQVQ